jgi:ElaB/YqjD/DUF883 family membrane-anchored ribosome-binding protein
VDERHSILVRDQERMLQTIQDSYNTLHGQVSYYLKQEIESLRFSSDENLKRAIEQISKGFGTRQVANNKAVKRLEKFIRNNPAITGKRWTRVEENLITLALDSGAYCVSNWVKTRLNHALVAQTKRMQRHLREELAP